MRTPITLNLKQLIGFQLITINKVLCSIEFIQTVVEL